MRTTLTIDDDILAAAKHLAEREQKTIGEVVSALARQGLVRGRRARDHSETVCRFLRADADTPVTMELVNQLRDELP